MHSAILRGNDFVIQSNGLTVCHADFFSGFTIDTRVGLFTPNGLDGIGAANLVLGFVTAFYDRHREISDRFHAYPEYRTFQCGSQIADYGMLDIYPIEKNIRSKNTPVAVLRAVIEHKINILLIPDTMSDKSKVNSDLIATAEKTVHTCYLYSPEGEVSSPDTTINCSKPEIFDWINAVADTMPVNTDNQITIPTPPILKQSYLRLSLDSALKHL